jgi:hypothetical protein
MAQRSGPPDVRPDQHRLDLRPLGNHRPDGGPAGEDERRERTYSWEDPAACPGR